jgi:Protein of unknown function (DUF3455)
VLLRIAAVHLRLTSFLVSENAAMRIYDAKRIVVILFAVLTSTCVASHAETKSDIPESLKAQSDEQLQLEAHATGVQIYECKANKDDATRFEWVLKAPEADLFDAAGKKIGKHYAGPTWESNDGSNVVGEVKAKDPGPDSNAIPWLLLRAKSTSGPGVFDKTQTIQRLQTVGGKAPADGCNQTLAGALTRVPYKATYLFYSAKP